MAARLGLGIKFVVGALGKMKAQVSRNRDMAKLHVERVNSN